MNLDEIIYWLNKALDKGIGYPYKPIPDAIEAAIQELEQKPYVRTNKGKERRNEKE